MKTAPPKRSSARIDVHYDAMLITSDGHEISVVVKDLSAEGFRIQLADEVLAGEQVRLRTRKSGEVPARIVWSHGSEAGGVFLDKAVVT